MIKASTPRVVGALLAPVLMALPASASTIYYDSLQRGPAPGWHATHGRWHWTDQGLVSSHGENRIFLDVLDDESEYKVDFSADLLKGKGWALFWASSLDGRKRVSGYSFQYDPGYGAGAYLLRQWQKNRESVLLAVPADLDQGVFHDFAFTIGSDGFRALQDGRPVLSYDKPLEPSGDLLGFRTWANSQAVFRNFNVATQTTPVPEPGTLLLLALGAAMYPRRRRLT